MDDASRPRWQTPSPVRTKMIPRPIVNSIYVHSSSPSSANQSLHESSRHTWSVRKQRLLEADLQLLLDAQAEGLSQGLDTSSQPPNDASLSGLSSPTASTLHSQLRDRTPTRSARNVGLRDARRGLYTTIRKLALLKADETNELQAEVQTSTDTVKQLEQWAHKQDVLKARAEKIRSGDQHQRAGELRTEADRMQGEIDDLEQRLAEMKGMQRRLRREAEEVENSVEAKLASYQRNMETLEREVKTFLKDTTGRAPVVWKDGVKGGLEELGQAKRSWMKERDEAMSKYEKADEERRALDEGAVVWKEVIQEVNTFEAQLRDEMGNMRDLGQELDRDATTGMMSVMEGMEYTIAKLEDRLRLAEDRNWKLLIAAIGAELEAFRQGREVLHAALGMTNGDKQSGQNPDEAADEHDDDYDEAVSSAIRIGQSQKKPNADGGDEIRGLDQAFAPTHQRHSSGTDGDTDDDGGDPSHLLISHQDTDTE